MGFMQALLQKALVIKTFQVFSLINMYYHLFMEINAIGIGPLTACPSICIHPVVGNSIKWLFPSDGV